MKYQATLTLPSLTSKVHLPPPQIQACSLEHPKDSLLPLPVHSLKQCETSLFEEIPLTLEHGDSYNMTLNLARLNGMNPSKCGVLLDDILP